MAFVFKWRHFARFCVVDAIMDFLKSEFTLFFFSLFPVHFNYKNISNYCHAIYTSIGSSIILSYHQKNINSSRLELESTR